MKSKLLTAVLVLLVFYAFPAGAGLLGLTRTSATIVRKTSHFLVGVAWPAAPKGPHARLLSAALNVTTDHESLALLVSQFLRAQHHSSPGLEDEFIAFLQREAAASRVGLERALDAVLATYRFLSPFLVAYAAVRLFRGAASHGANGETPSRQAAGGPAAQSEEPGSAGEGAKEPDRLPTEELRRLFSEIDTNQDGQISKRELLLALRRDSSLADLFGMPAKVSQSRADGSYEVFEQAFAEIDQDRDDAISWAEFGNLFRRRRREAAAAAAEAARAGRRAEAGGWADGAAGVAAAAGVTATSPGGGSSARPRRRKGSPSGDARAAVAATHKQRHDGGW